MESDGVITHQQAEQARSCAAGAAHLPSRRGRWRPWFQEEVRRELEKRFGTEQVHEAGLRVETTLDLDLQQTANRAVADGLAAYERRHGWKGKLENVLARGDDRSRTTSIPTGRWQPQPGDYVHALVTARCRWKFMRAVGASQIVICCLRTGSGPASAMATRWSSRATSFTFIWRDAMEGGGAAPRWSRTPARRAR